MSTLSPNLLRKNYNAEIFMMVFQHRLRLTNVDKSNIITLSGITEIEYAS